MMARLLMLGLCLAAPLRADDLPAKAVPLFVKAEALAKQGKPNGAVLIYKQIRAEYKTGPAYARATIALAALYYDRAQFDTAADYYRELIRKFPEHPEAESFHMDLASAEIERGNHAAGFKRLLELARKQAVAGKL